MAIWDILTARRRSDAQPHALECTDGGALYIHGPGAGGGMAVTIADGADVAQGATTDIESAVGNGTVIAILKRLRTLLNGGLPAALGQAAMAASLPVVVASDQTAVPVSTDSDMIWQTPTVTAGAYAANDAVGGLLTFANAAVSGEGGVVKNVLIIDDAGQDAEMELWLFRETFTNMADNAPWAPSEADLRKLVAIISTADGAWFAAGTPSVARIEVSQEVKLVGTSLFGQLVTRDTPTFAATDDVSVGVGLLMD